MRVRSGCVVCWQRFAGYLLVAEGIRAPSSAAVEALTTVADGEVVRRKLNFLRQLPSERDVAVHKCCTTCAQTSFISFTQYVN